MLAKTFTPVEVNQLPSEVVCSFYDEKHIYLFTKMCLLLDKLAIHPANGTFLYRLLQFQHNPAVQLHTMTCEGRTSFIVKDCKGYTLEVDR